MVTIANPIYDVVFKYMMEDKRVAGIILSSLLKQKVVELEFRKNEYSNISRDEMSIFRIDFGATIEEEDGTRKMVLIELQKTWVPTETLRFRQYLGAQYASRDNLLKEECGNALPLITIYILGHCIGDLEEPVIYVRRQVYDYQGRPVIKGIPNRFIDSLTHDSIIVQIPLLRGRVSNRLERILSVFDQSQATDDNAQFLHFDESLCESDSEMKQILFRLTAAAADAKIRHNMNVEEEYFGIIEEKDTELQRQNQLLAENGARIREQGAQIKEQDAQIKEQDAQIKEREVQIKEQDALISTLVKGMLASGKSLEEISGMTGKSIEDIRRLSAG